MLDRTRVEDPFLREAYEVLHHESGLTVYVFPKRLSTTYASLTVHFGSLDSSFRFSDEDEPLTMPDGIAHFLEHKMFESEDHVDTFDKFAALGASANAYTSNEATTYLFSTAEKLDPPLSLLLDYVFHPYFTEKNVEKERGIIGQEIKMYDDAPLSRLYASMMELLYVNHGVRTNICGSVASIAEITPELLLRCHRAFYRPERMTLIVVGNVTVEDVMRTVDKALPKLPEIPPVLLEYPTEPDALYAYAREFTMDISRPKLCIGFKDTAIPEEPEARERRAIAMNLLCDLYFGESTPFYDELYREGLISRDFSAYYESLRGCGHLLLCGSTDEPERLLAVLREKIARIAEGEETAEADFLRIRSVHYAEYVKDFDSTEEIAAALLDAILDGTELFKTGAAIHSIAHDEIGALAREFFSQKPFAHTVISPMKGTINA